MVKPRIVGKGVASMVLRRDRLRDGEEATGIRSCGIESNSSDPSSILIRGKGNVSMRK